MKSDDAAEPIEWDLQELKRAVDEWEGIATEIIALMHETADSPRSQNWRPHFTQIATVVERFRQRCRFASELFGFLSADQFAPEETYDHVHSEGEQLVRWLNRMM